VWQKVSPNYNVMTSTLNQTQQTFLKWLVETVRKENFREDNLMFLFARSLVKLCDGIIEEEIPEELNLQRATLDVLYREGYLHCSGKDHDAYICSLTQKAYQIVDCNFVLPPENQANNININNSTGVQIGNSSNQEITTELSSVYKKDEGSKVLSFFSHPVFLEVLKGIFAISGSAASAALINYYLSTRK
jgi:hypothetical protein